MKNISLFNILVQLKNVIVRFPVSVFFSLLLFIAGCVAIEERDFDSIGKFLLILPLGYVLSLAVRVFSEDQGWTGGRKWADVLVVPLMALYYFLLPERYDLSEHEIIIYIIFCIVAVILLTIAICCSGKQPMAFWQYNVKIWWHFLFSLLCTSVFVGGLSLALIAVDKLFDVRVSDKWFFYLSAFFYSLFFPLLFAAGVPKKSQAQEVKTYPFLRIFGQYVLLPILSIYLLILYAYGLKILFTWELPDGSLAWMVLIFSGAGILTYFMLHNLYITRDTKIAALFGRYFFFAEIPLIGLLFLAILRRITDYGITEHRYFILLSACWLLGISLYMIFTKGKTIRPILISFAAVALLSSFGPWSVFTVSYKSQACRLEKLLDKNGLLVDGKYYTPTDSEQEVEMTNYDEIREVIIYFGRKKATSYIQPLFNTNIDSLSQEDGYWNLAEKLLLNIHAVYELEECAESAEFTIALTGSALINTAGYDSFFHCSYYRWNESDDTVEEDSSIAYIIKTRPEGFIEIYHHGILYKRINAVEIAKKMMKNLDIDKSSYSWEFPQEQLITDENDYRVVFTQIKGDRSDGLTIEEAEMYVLIKK